MPLILCFDTETTGKPPNNERYFNESKGAKAEEWPRVIQLAFVLYDTEKQKQLAFYDKLIKLPDGQTVPPDSTEIHGISDDDLEQNGITMRTALTMFMNFYNKADFVVGHNIQYDINVICAELTLLIRHPDTSAQDKTIMKETINKLLWDKAKRYCTLQNSRKVCNLPKYIYEMDEVLRDETGREVIDYSFDAYGRRKIRNPRLETAHQVMFGQKSNGQLHNALVDVAVCLRIFMKLYKGIDICNSDFKASNEFICKTINPSDLIPSEIPRRVGEPAIHPDILRQINAISFKLTGTRTRTRSRKTRSLSLKRKSSIKRPILAKSV